MWTEVSWRISGNSQSKTKERISEKKTRPGNISPGGNRKKQDKELDYENRIDQ